MLVSISDEEHVWMVYFMYVLGVGFKDLHVGMQKKIYLRFLP